MRRRDPPPPKAICIRCGWSGTPHHSLLRDDHGDVSLIVSAKQCPICRAELVQLREQKRPLPLQIVIAVRDANLSPDDFVLLTTAVQEASSNTSPRDLATQVPAASKIVNIASRAGENWINLLALVLTMIGIYVAHMDATRAHRDAQEAIDQAREEAERSRHAEQRIDRPTGVLSQDDIERIAKQIEAAIERSEAP